MTLFKLLLLSTLSVNTLFATVTLDEKIASLVVLGFHGTSINQSSPIVKEIEAGLGGVILFDQDPMNKMKRKNIVNAKQLQRLNEDLQRVSTETLLICVDEEGGKVARLKARDGFATFDSAQEIAKGSEKSAWQQYEAMAEMLYANGINTNFAPSVDLLFPYNPIIAGKKRSYSSDPNEVYRFASIFVQAHRNHHVMTVLKHFPGHGSSKADSHKGFTDVSATWSTKELAPFKKMIDDEKVDMIMTAHIFNKHLDATYPATLSYQTNTKLLRETLHFKGVIITDDLQMAAIRKHYTLKETIVLALNSGVDILLFANQLSTPLALDTVVKIVKDALKEGDLSHKRIDEAYAHVKALKEGM